MPKHQKFVIPSLLFLLTISLFYGCKQDPLANQPSPEEIAEYITGYSTGVIGKSEPIRVQFAEAVGGVNADETEAAADLLTFEPSRAGRAVWENSRTLRFEPTEGWEVGQAYIATIHLDRAIDTLSAGPKTYSFGFNIRKQTLRVIVDGLQAAGTDLARQQITGSILTGDNISPAETANLITAIQEGRSLPVSFTGEGRNYQFVIADVRRGEAASQVEISWDGTGLGNAELSGQRQVSVPAIGDFLVTEVVTERDPEARIRIRFSDPLDPDQDLTGLIALSDGSAMRTRIEGNLVYAYLNDDRTAQETLRIAATIKNAAGRELGRATEHQLSIAQPDPAIRLVGDGVVLPHQGQRLFPFEAIGLEAVELEVFKVFDNNVMQFLQQNNLAYSGSSYEMRRVGRIISRDRLILSDLASDVDLGSWTRYAIDLSDYLEEDPHAIYQIRLGFFMEDAFRTCSESPEEMGITNQYTVDDEPPLVGYEQDDRTFLNAYNGVYGYIRDADWDDRQDACHPYYYNSDRFVSRNLISSNLGVIAKRNEDRSTMVLVTDLITARPVNGAIVSLFDAQQQQLASLITDADGQVGTLTDYEPAYVIVKKDGDAGYLELESDNLLSMSKFNVSGVTARAGVKGAFYAERGVWRPGDRVYLNFVLEDRLAKLPPSYPLEFELVDSRGRSREKRSIRAEVGDIYPLHFDTDPDDPTGNWRAIVRIGGQTFYRTLKIETIKPNRLKIDLDFNDAPLSPRNRRVGLNAAYLHGAPARELGADVNWEVRADYSGFEDWPQYSWHDPARRQRNYTTNEIFDGQLDAEGNTSFEIPTLSEAMSGPMRAAFKTRVYEPGGNFSVDNISTDYRPYAVLAGLRLPRNRWGGKEMNRNQDNTIELATINPDGTAAGGRNLSVGVYRVDWRYWWQDNNDNVSRFNSTQHHQALSKGDVQTNGQGKANYTVRVSDWGRYLVRICDTQSGHCTGDYFYAGSPNRDGMDREAASILQLRTDKTEYANGEEVELTIPGSQGGMALVSLENSTGVVETHWLQMKSGENSFRFKADERMVPTVYANVTLVQPYEQTINDRPIRLYGVVGIGVVNPETRLEPTIATAEEYEPEETVTIRVAESEGKAMNYTLAVVDEGLLSLTRFSTPDLWDQFFSKEALGVRTYDMFRYVIGNMGNSFDRVLAIGGDDAEGGDADRERANRFEPVVRHLGPFSLAAGRTNTHEVELPNYVGAVRVMVVAEGDRAYGSAEENVPVRKPLMVLPTLPRAIGPGESLDMPVNVFAMTDQVRSAQVSVTESSNLVSIGENQKNCSFDQPGDELLRFPLQVGNQLGVARFQVLAEGSGERITQEIEIDVRNPNSQQLKVDRLTLAPGESQTVTFAPFGSIGTRSAFVELAGIPTVNLERHLGYLLRYPYGCLEQTVSPAFAQLHLHKLVELSTADQQRAQDNVRVALNRLARFQTSTGSMAYWPGRSYAQPWATNYATHFMLEAEAAGYSLPIGVKDRLIEFQKRAAANWRTTVYDFYANDYQRRLDQAYRLYTLALAGQADLGAMNRLRGQSLSNAAKFRLAAAYSLAGKQSVADELFGNSVPGTGRDGRREMGYTFGSEIRDMAMLLESCLLSGNDDQANQLVLRLAEAVNRRGWLSTQEAAFVILSMGKMMGEATSGQPVLATYTPAAGAALDVGNTDAAFVSIELPTEGNNQQFQLRNRGNATMYVSVITGGVPEPGQETSSEENLRLAVRYTDLNGRTLDVSSLRAGTDFVAEYTVTNPGTLAMNYRQLALRQPVASGWEIVNERMDAVSDGQSESGYEYRDLRDDRVYTFFHLNRGQTNTYRLRLTAAYPGRYYLPGQVCEAMYDNEIQAATQGQWVEVVE
ncbi:MAG: MG2 domain-containing protein [Bacteroidota bacterium]